MAVLHKIRDGARAAYSLGDHPQVSLGGFQRLTDLGDGAVGINFGSMYLDHWSWVCLDVIKHFYETDEFVETGSDYLDGQNENVIGSIVEAQGKTWDDVKIIHEVNRTA